MPKPSLTAASDTNLSMWQPHRPVRPEKIEGGQTFRLVSEFEPKGDQVKAIPELVAGVNSIDRDQVLLGVSKVSSRIMPSNISSLIMIIINPKPMCRGQIHSLKKTPA